MRCQSRSARQDSDTITRRGCASRSRTSSRARRASSRRLATRLPDSASNPIKARSQTRVSADPRIVSRIARQDANDHARRPMRASRLAATVATPLLRPGEGTSPSVRRPDRFGQAEIAFHLDCRDIRARLLHDRRAGAVFRDSLPSRHAHGAFVQRAQAVRGCQHRPRSDQSAATEPPDIHVLSGQGNRK